MKVFGGLMTVLLLIFLLLGGYIVYEYFETMTPAWQQEASAEAVMNVQDHQNEVINAAERRAAWTEFYKWLLPIMLIFIVAGGGIVGYIKLDQRSESWARPVDGSYALQFRGSWFGKRFIIDPNKTIYGMTSIDNKRGQISGEAPLVDVDRQLAYVMGIQATRTAQAVDYSSIRSMSAAAALNGRYTPQVKPEQYRVIDAEVTKLPLVTAYQPINLLEAFAQSKKNQWLIGQNENGLCTFDISQVVHTGLLGATKTGKTSGTALLMALNARKQGMHVIALDGADGVDWTTHNRLFEVHETDYTMIGDQCHEIAAIHARRMKEIKLHGVPNIDELDYTLPSLFVILEEFGKTFQAFKAANAAQYEMIVSELSNLMRVSRKTGIYFMLIDQSMNAWDRRFKPNVKDYIAYHLGAKQGSAFDAYDLHKLKPVGQFWNAGQVYDSWFTKGEIKTLQQSLTPIKAKLLTDSESSANDTGIDTGIVDIGVSKAKRYPPARDTGIVNLNDFTPVNDTGIDTGIVPNGSNDTGIDTGIVEPRLTGKPVSNRERALVMAEYKLQGSINKTCVALYGSMTVSRKGWIKEVLGQGGLLQ